MKDSDGRTALWYSMALLDEKHRECFEVLNQIEEERKDYDLVQEIRKGCKCGGANDLFDAAQKGCCYCCWKHIDQAGKTRDDYKIPNWGTYSGVTALMVAAAYGKASVVRMLLGKEGGRHETTYGYTAMMFAASNGHTECVRLLADKENGMKDKYGYTALMYAAWKGHLECVKILAPLEKGMKDGGETALMKAAYNGHLECVKILAPLEKGMKDNNGYTAKDWASWNNHNDVVNYLNQFPEED